MSEMEMAGNSIALLGAAKTGADLAAQQQGTSG
jgi:hypothetical protein